MDALSDVLRVARLTGGVFLHAEFSAPWCVATKVSPDACGPALGPASHLIPYHYVVDGEFRLRLEHPAMGEVVSLSRGDVVLLPHNDLHVMGSDLGLPAVPGRQIMRRPDDGALLSMRHGGDGAPARIICGFLGYDGEEMNPLLGGLPPVLKLGLDQGAGAAWIRSTFQFAAEEVAAGRAGSATVLAKVSELLFVEAVRRYAATLPDGRTGWLAGLRDPHVARALALLHRDISRPWTVEDLGRAVGLSRSALADRFIRLIGVPPIHYLASWRIQVAAQKLRTTADSLAEVASTVGYESEAAFSRAFKKALGSAPALWRRARAADPQAGTHAR